MDIKTPVKIAIVTLIMTRDEPGRLRPVEGRRFVAVYWSGCLSERRAGFDGNCVSRKSSTPQPGWFVFPLHQCGIAAALVGVMYLVPEWSQGCRSPDASDGGIGVVAYFATLLLRRAA